jgi:hypothetical protein
MAKSGLFTEEKRLLTKTKLMVLRFGNHLVFRLVKYRSRKSSYYFSAIWTKDSLTIFGISGYQEFEKFA